MRRCFKFGLYCPDRCTATRHEDCARPHDPPMPLPDLERIVSSSETPSQGILSQPGIGRRSHARGHTEEPEVPLE